MVVTPLPIMGRCCVFPLLPLHAHRWLFWGCSFAQHTPCQVPALKNLKPESQGCSLRAVIHAAAGPNSVPISVSALGGFMPSASARGDAQHRVSTTAHRLLMHQCSGSVWPSCLFGRILMEEPRTSGDSEQALTLANEAGRVEHILYPSLQLSCYRAAANQGAKPGTHKKLPKQPALT